MEYFLIVNSQNLEEIGNILRSNEKNTYNQCNRFVHYEVKLLSPMEYTYYSKIDKKERVKLYEDDFYNKLKELRLDDICCVNIYGISTICKMKEKTVTGNNLLFTFEATVFNFFHIYNC